MDQFIWSLLVQKTPETSLLQDIHEGRIVFVKSCTYLTSQSDERFRQKDQMGEPTMVLT